MKVKKCNKCNLINRESDKFCVSCGNPLENDAIEQEPINDTHSNEEPKDPLNPMKTFWRVIKILITAFFLFATIYSQENIFLIFAIIPGISLLDELINLKYPEDKRYVGFLHPSRKFKLYGLTLIFLNALTVGNITNLFDSEPVEEPVIEVGYGYEIENGYEYIEPISVDEMKMRVKAEIDKQTTDYEYLTVEEKGDQFEINFDITSIDNVNDAATLFKSIVNNLTISKANYSYIKDLSAHFYYNGEYLYTARLYNLFLIDVISLEQDGYFYDSNSNMTVLFKTLSETNFEFPS